MDKKLEAERHFTASGDAGRPKRLRGIEFRMMRDLAQRVFEALKRTPKMEEMIGEHGGPEPPSNARTSAVVTTDLRHVTSLEARRMGAGGGATGV